MSSLRRAYAALRSAGVLKAELAVTGFCYLLPDLVDKPLWMLGIGCGRFVGHTLLFVFLVAFVFSLGQKRYGLFALVGMILHLLADAGWFLPWLYPFAKYDFPQLKFWAAFRWYEVAGLFMELALVMLAVSLVLWLLSLIKKLGNRGARYHEPVERADNLQAFEARRRASAYFPSSKPKLQRWDGVEMGTANSEKGQTSAHGSILCWTARITGTLLSLLAVSYLLSATAKWDAGWMAILAAIYVFLLSLAPSVIAWWSHRLGGILMVVVCFGYAEGASILGNRATFVEVLLPFSAVWFASGILHLVVAWKER